MTKKLKFRAWDATHKRMVYDFAPYDEKTIFKITTDKKSIVSLPVDYIMQFTGLQDVNNRDIYEGDIVRITHQTESEMPPSVHEVAWLPLWGIQPAMGLWGDYFIRAYCWTTKFVYITDRWFNGYPLDELIRNENTPYKVEVIGNVHENPELLLFEYLRVRGKEAQPNLIKPQVTGILGKRDCERTYDIWFVVEDFHDSELDDAIAEIMTDVLENFPLFRLNFHAVEDPRYFDYDVEIYKNVFVRTKNDAE